MCYTAAEAAARVAYALVQLSEMHEDAALKGNESGGQWIRWLIGSVGIYIMFAFNTMFRNAREEPVKALERAVLAMWAVNRKMEKESGYLPPD